MNEETRENVQRAIGWLAALAFLALAGLSMMAPYELTVPVIVGSLLIIGMLLGKINEIARLVDSWKGSGGGDRRRGG